MRIEVLSLNNPSDSLINYVIDCLQKAFDIKIVKGISLYLPEGFIDISRLQYRGGEVLRWVSESYGGSGKILLGIVEGDAYVEGLNFIFGIASPVLKTALVFTSRLKYLADEKLFMERVLKEVMHELGHIFRLSHCPNRRCVMSFSNSILDVDMKSWRYCLNCFRKLRDLGIQVRDDALLRE